MKVLQVINSLKTGGAEKLVTDLVPLLNTDGTVCDILLLDNSVTPFYEKLKSQGYTIHAIHSKSVYNPLNAFKIIKHIKKYDVIHAHLFPVVYWVVLAKLFSFSKIKMIYTEHSTTNRRRSKTIFRIIDRIVYKSFSKIICISEEVCRELKSHLKFDSDKFEIFPNGVDISKINQAIPYKKEVFSFSEDMFLMVMVARFNPPKDHQTVIRALSHLPDNVGLLLVGEGNLKNQSEELVSQLNLEHRVRFLGIRMDVYELLKTADVIVLSSKHEGLSLASIEGLASGKPFVASKVPGLTDIVEGAGLLFEFGNEKELAEHILKLMTDKAYSEEIVLKSKQRASKYDISNLSSSLIKLYKTI